MQKYSDVVLDKNGKAISGAVITVKTYPEGAPATIYAADGGPAVVSIQTDSAGRFSFYAANGHYSLTVSGTGITPFVYDDIILYDPSEKEIAYAEAFFVAGEADSTAMLQRAIDAVYAAGGGEVRLKGEYFVSASSLTDLFWYASVTTKAMASDVCALVLRSGVTLVGKNPHRTKITGTDRTRTVICCVSMDGGGLRDLHVRNGWNPALSGSGHGVLLAISNLGDNNKNLNFERLEISNVGSYGIGAQWGNFKNNRYHEIYVHDTGADAIDHKVRGGDGMVQATSRGVSFSNILVEKYGQRPGIVNSAGIDIRGPATVTNFHARNFGAAGGTNVGIRFSAGTYYDATGSDNRESSSNSALTNFYIESDPAYSTSGVVLLSSEGTTVSNGTVRGTTAFGVSVENSASGYGISRDNCIHGVKVEAVRGGTAFRTASGSEMTAFIGCRSRGEYTEFTSQRGNIAAGQTVFNASYDPATVIVQKNGVNLVSGTDYTATDGTTVTLAAGVLGTDTIAVVTPNAKGWDISGKYNQIANCGATFTTTVETVAAAAADTLRRVGNEFGFDGIRAVETSNNPRLESYGPDSNIDFRVDAKGTGSFEARSNGGRAFRAVNSSPSAVNWLQAKGGAAGGAVELSAQGSDAGIDLLLTPKGAGNVRFGALTASADAPVTGYIVVKDAAGTTRKLAVIA